jgi:hypothetical protein
LSRLWWLWWSWWSWPICLSVELRRREEGRGRRKRMVESM